MDDYINPLDKQKYIHDYLVEKLENAGERDYIRLARNTLRQMFLNDEIDYYYELYKKEEYKKRDEIKWESNCTRCIDYKYV